MRNIEKETNHAISALLNNRGVYRWQKANTSITSNYAGECEVFLHNNHIATVSKEGLKVNLYTLRKWPSMTTRSRLRALGADLVSIKGTLHLDGRSIWEGA